MAQYAEGQRGTLRIGMECAPCYAWLLKVVAPYLAAWPDVDVDVKTLLDLARDRGLSGEGDEEDDEPDGPDHARRPATPASSKVAISS